MRVSQRLDYALRALVLLAEQPAESWVVAGDLAERLALPKRFVEQQITALSRAGILACRRGATGGCALALAAESVSVLDVATALEGEVIDVPRQPGSATAEMWRTASDSLCAFLSGVSLADLAARQKQLDRETAPMYYI